MEIIALRYFPAIAGGENMTRAAEPVKVQLSLYPRKGQMGDMMLRVSPLA